MNGEFSHVTRVTKTELNPSLIASHVAIASDELFAPLLVPRANVDHTSDGIACSVLGDQSDGNELPRAFRCVEDQ